MMMILSSKKALLKVVRMMLKQEAFAGRMMRKARRRGRRALLKVVRMMLTQEAFAGRMMRKARRRGRQEEDVLF